MPFKQNKKAQIGGKTLNRLFGILVTVVIMAVIYYLTSLFIDITQDTSQIEAQLLVQFLLSSGDGLAYTDPQTGTVILGVIDRQKLAETGIEEKLANSYCFNTKNCANQKEMAALIEINTIKGKSNYFYNRNQYFNWEALTKIKGPGGATETESNHFVLLRDSDGKLNEAEIKVTVLKQNE